MNVKTFPHLYCRDSRGRTRIWSLSCTDKTFTVKHGLLDGKLVSQTTRCEPKHLGKANETTIAEQALSEATAKFRHQIDREDYNEDVDQSGLQFRPMLAQDYLEVPHLADWTRTLAQPKLNGLRLNYGRRTLTASDDEFVSRKGINYALPHLEAGCLELRTLVNDILKDAGGYCQMLDGEAYRHGWTLQKIGSAARRLQSATAELDYVLFDLFIPDMVFEDRHNLLEYALEQVAPQHPQLKLVTCQPCHSEAQAKDLRNMYMRHKFEGAILRHRDSEYAPAFRSSDLFKFKDFLEAECRITGIKIGKDGCAVLLCVHPDTGREFGCTPAKTQEERKAMVDDRSLLGQYVTVKYQELSEDGSPASAVGLEIRELNDAGEPLY